MGPGVPPPLSSPTHQIESCIALHLSRLSQRVQYQRVHHLRSRAWWFFTHTISSSYPEVASTTAPSSVSPKKPSTISTGQLQTLLPFHLPPIKLVVSQRSYGLLDLGYLILRQVSHLDAFSGYPFRRSLLGYALGRTTDTRALRPPRSSRTRGSSSQIPYAHSG